MKDAEMQVHFLLWNEGAWSYVEPNRHPVIFGELRHFSHSSYSFFEKQHSGDELSYWMLRSGWHEWLYSLCSETFLDAPDMVLYTWNYCDLFCRTEDIYSSSWPSLLLKGLAGSFLSAGLKKHTADIKQDVTIPWLLIRNKRDIFLLFNKFTPEYEWLFWRDCGPFYYTEAPKENW